MTELTPEKLPQTISWAKERGLTQIMVPSLDGPRNPTMDDVKRLADRYNAIGAESRKAGLQQGLHTEGFELSMVDGKRVFDMLFDLLDPQLVKFQFQMSTITSGLVAADYFTAHPNRFISMHLQDLDMNAPVPPARARRPRRPRRRPPAEAHRAGQHRLGQDVPRRKDRRRTELLHRDERTAHARERAVSEGARCMSET